MCCIARYGRSAVLFDQPYMLNAVEFADAKRLVAVAVATCNTRCTYWVAADNTTQSASRTCSTFCQGTALYQCVVLMVCQTESIGCMSLSFLPPIDARAIALLNVVTCLGHNRYPWDIPLCLASLRLLLWAYHRRRVPGIRSGLDMKHLWYSHNPPCIENEEMIKTRTLIKAQVQGIQVFIS